MKLSEADAEGFRRVMVDDLKELIAEFGSLHDRMQVLVAEFAELVDLARPLIKEYDPELERPNDVDWRTVEAVYNNE